jgi:hypothetical protein
MPRFEVSNSKASIASANVAMWQLKCAATSRCRVFEISLSIATAPPTAPSWRLCRSTALGTSSATQAAEEQDPGGPAATTVLDTTWSVQPTLSAVPMRRYATPLTAGSGIVWTWPDHRPLIVPLSTGIVVVNDISAGGTTGLFVCSMVFEE